jgi:radical SAM superfamily enzyme YgiQ (UPF0313 family)
MTASYEIVLATLNARYIHASLGLRYLQANLGEYRTRSVIKEFTTKRAVDEIVEQILAVHPRIVGLGVYIWNTRESLAVARELKRRCPELILVVGGPEVSFETETQEIFALVDHVFQGEADFTFRDFVHQFLSDKLRPADKIIAPRLPDIDKICLPYDEYSDEDILHRVLYVEASRGCPYKCEYCLSALDKSVRTFNLDEFLAALEKLLARGARQFKFVDRTFNLAPSTSQRILEFFLQHIDLGLFLHFEMVPDRLPETLRTLIQRFPAGSLQFEIGIQTWNSSVARIVSRRQDFNKVVENLNYLKQHTQVHTHCDLIVGLPGEDQDSFKLGFNTLYALQPDEIQVGVLKRLKGAPLIRHEPAYALRFSSEPPFQILSSSCLSAQQVSGLTVFADFWDQLGNSGRFPGLKTLCAEQGLDPFEFFYAFAQWLFEHFEKRTHSIHLRDLQSAVQKYLIARGWSVSEAGQQLIATRVGASPSRQAQHLAAKSVPASVKNL